ncbi:MAG: 1,6-anhydro-N-acetylmuramyl-L-alanine amidase AmpD [Pseudomonadota bacterium]
MEHDSGGWFAGSRRYPSPNFNRRPIGSWPELIVIHGISLPPGRFGSDDIASFFSNRLDCTQHPFYREIEDLRVSAHFLIERTGSVTQFVSCDHRAWHAGQSCWQGRANCNDFSLGIELEGTDTTPYEKAQYHSLALLTRALFSRYRSLDLQNIVGHSDIAPERKTDPGPAFDWALYHAQLAALLEQNPVGRVNRTGAISTTDDSPDLRASPL